MAALVPVILVEDSTNSPKPKGEPGGAQPSTPTASPR